MGSYMDTVNKWLAELGSQVNIPGLSLNEDGMCSFRYKKDIVLYVELPEGSPSIYFNSPMIRVPDESRTELYDGLLRLNFYGLQTNGAFFSIDKRDESIVLCNGYLIDKLNSSLFMQSLSTFIETAEKWHQILNRADRVDLINGGLDEETPAAAAPEAPSDDLGQPRA